MPRIDYERKRGRFGVVTDQDRSTDPEAGSARKPRWKRPPAALFDPSKVADRVSSEGSYVIFEGNRYDSNGFLRKDFRMHTVVSNDN